MSFFNQLHPLASLEYYIILSCCALAVPLTFDWMSSSASIDLESITNNYINIFMYNDTYVIYQYKLSKQLVDCLYMIFLPPH